MIEKDEIVVSCIIPTFNRSELLKEAIESTIAQTFEAWELIVVDDQSSDDTREVVKDYAEKDNRIHYYVNPDKGANRARNLGISKARGKYIAFLDDDDISLPHRFQSQVNAMQTSGSRFINSWFEVRDRTTGKYITANRTVHKGDGAGLPSRWMIEKALLDEVGGFHPEMIAMQEVELSYRLAKKYTYHHHDDIVTIMYSTTASTSKGVQGTMGKVQLMEEAGHLMHPIEAAWWYYAIAMGYYRSGNNPQVTYFLKKAAVLDKRIFWRIIYMYILMVKSVNLKLIRNLNLKLLQYFSKFYFPVLVNHPVIRPD